MVVVALGTVVFFGGVGDADALVGEADGALAVVVFALMVGDALAGAVVAFEMEFDAVVVLAVEAKVELFIGATETEFKVEAGVEFAGRFAGAGVADAGTGVIVGPSAKTGDGTNASVKNNAVAIKREKVTAFTGIIGAHSREGFLRSITT